MRNLRDAIIELLKAKEDVVLKRLEYRAQIDSGLCSEDVNLYDETKYARSDLRRCAEFAGELARMTEDVFLLGLATNYVMDVEAAEDAEDRARHEREHERKAEWAYWREVGRLIDAALVDFTFDRAEIHSRVDAEGESMGPLWVERSHAYIEHAGRARMLREAMQKDLVATHQRLGRLPTLDEVKASAVANVPALLTHIQTYLFAPVEVEKERARELRARRTRRSGVG